MALGVRFDERADPAEEQQVDLSHQQMADQVCRGQVVLGDAKNLLHLGADRNRLQGAIEHAAASRDQRPIVIAPARSRQVKQPLALGKACRRVGLRIDKDVEMVERGQEPCVARLQQSVAEHVARHVADADHREAAGLDIAAELAKMPLDELPGAARGDPHRLVVIAGRAARGEGVAEPKTVFGGDLVGDVGESGGALVGSDDEIRVVTVVAHDIGRRHHDMPRRAAVGSFRDDIVGQVEQAADQDLVALDPLGRQRVPAGRRALDDEPAL